MLLLGILHDKGCLIMTSTTTPFKAFISTVKASLGTFKFSEFIVSSFIFQLSCALVMTGAFFYGIEAQRREVIVFTAMNAIWSFCLLAFILWMTMTKKLPDRYYSWSACLNYVSTLLLIPYVFLMSKSNVVFYPIIFFGVNIFNLCLLLHLFNLRTHYHHDWAAVRKMTQKRDGFDIVLTMGIQLKLLLPVGLVTIYFDKFILGDKEYDIFWLTDYFKEHDLDLATVTIEDFQLYDMIKY